MIEVKTVELQTIQNDLSLFMHDIWPQSIGGCDSVN